MNLKAFLLLAAGCLCLAFTSSAAAFIKFDGVDGESNDANHRNWCDLQSLSHSIQRTTDAATGATGRTVFDPFTIVKELDKATPKLVEAICTGKAIPLVTIDATMAMGEARVTYLKYELKNVVVTSYNLGGSANEAAIPTEQLSLNFEEIKVTYTEFDAAGRKVGDVIATCKVEQIKP